MSYSSIGLSAWLQSKQNPEPWSWHRFTQNKMKPTAKVLRNTPTAWSNNDKPCLQQLIFWKDFKKFLKLISKHKLNILIDDRLYILQCFWKCELETLVFSIELAQYRDTKSIWQRMSGLRNLRTNILTINFKSFYL